MPCTRRAGAGWNYETAAGAGTNFEPATHYWMNSLQGVPDRENYFVSINRADHNLFHPHRSLTAGRTTTP